MMVVIFSLMVIFGLATAAIITLLLSTPTATTHFHIESASEGNYYTGFIDQISGADGKEFRLHGNYRHFWRRQADDDWRGDRGIKIEAPSEPGIYCVSWAFGLRCAPLVVSSAVGESRSDVIMIVPDYTWHAYNPVGGGSFYTSPEAHKLSLFRPLGNFISLHFIRYLAKRLLCKVNLRSIDLHDPAYHPQCFLEEELGVVDVAAQSFLDGAGRFSIADLALYKVIVLYGHDEYWSHSLRSLIEGAVKEGSHLLNLSGNTLWWVIEREKSAIRKNGYWHDCPDGGGESLLGVNFRFAGFPLPRYQPARLSQSTYHELLSLGFDHKIEAADALRQSKGFSVLDANHPLFAGTGLQSGEWFGVDSELNWLETDGWPMRASEQAMFVHDVSGHGRNIHALAESWTEQKGLGKKFDGFHRTASVVVVRHIESQVISLASIGWVRSILRGDREVLQITRNALRSLLNERAGKNES